MPRTVKVLGFVSLLADVASDMVAPILPVFLTTMLGAGPAALGFIEGVAETTASLVKLVSGRLADRGTSAKGLAVAGYLLAAAARPFLALATSWPHVLALRFTDRVGKGIRTAPRDAILSASVESAIRGRAFGFHRSMDHLGATLGPLVALALVALGVEMRALFVLALVPGLAAVVLLALGVPQQPRSLEVPRLQPLSWSSLPARLRRLLVASGLLAFASVPDAFLVLWLADRHLSLAWILLAWAAASAVRAATAWPAGWLSDHLGRTPVLVTTWVLRAAALAAIPGVSGVVTVISLYLTWCALTAATEGAERALIGDVAEPSVRGTAFGSYHLVVGLCALPGAAIFGALWQCVSLDVAFLYAAAFTLLAACWLGVAARMAHARRA